MQTLRGYCGNQKPVRTQTISLHRHELGYQELINWLAVERKDIPLYID